MHHCGIRLEPPQKDCLQTDHSSGVFWYHTPPRAAPAGALQLSGLDQALANELARCNSTGAGKEAAAGMGYELVEHVELSQLAENLDKADAGIALVAHEKKPGVIRDTLAPRRPALD